ncbi:pilus assembly protein PilM [Sporosarcina sp. E16_8]|uniref:type IV pilus biogenesis protein PilM n=1 Tax=Sporosarcina sp. E16_8 TaxID=2789295 RepID=UPI001A934C13|nr:pilus assembly protein PilM [Sporosarcina sp. E16_8]MBO0587093.1 pilus assembly protein PilM [Sporosarcina sp. E16_8]
MPMSIFTRRKRTESMTIEEDAVRFVRLKSIEPLVIDVAEEVLLPPNVVVEGKIVDSETLVTILDGAVGQWGISNRSVQFLAPDQYVIIRKVPYPMDVMADELKGYFFIEIGSTLYLPFDDPVFDVVPYKPNTETNEAIIIASKEGVLDRYEDVLKEVKLDPLKADITPLALYRLAFKQHKLSGKEHILLADLTHGKLTVSIFHEHYPLFMRPVDLENSTDLSVVRDFTSDTGIVTPSTIVMELEKLINFYRYNLWNGAASITHLLVNGEYSRMNELLSVIRDRLAIKADVLVKEPLHLANGEEIPARFNRTIGLALKEV